MPNSHGNDSAVAAFIAHKAEIDVLLDRPSALSDEHFGVAPDEVNWGHVGTLAEYAALLRRAAQLVIGNQESKSSK